MEEANIFDICNLELVKFVSSYDLVDRFGQQFEALVKESRLHIAVGLQLRESLEFCKFKEGGQVDIELS